MQTAAFAAVVLTSCVSAASPPSTSDFARAATPLPRAHLTGSTFVSRARVLNEALDTLDVQLKACEEYGMEELVAVWETLKASSHPELNDVYEQAGDNRRLSGLPEGLLIPDDDELKAVVRDSLCIESVMRYSHHLGESDKDEFHALSSLPTMPTKEHEQTKFSEEHNRVFAHYRQVRTCDICHADPAEIVNPDAPAWAENFFAVLSLNSTSFDGVPGPRRAALRYYSWPLRSFRDERTTGGFTDVSMRNGDGNLYMFTPWNEVCRVAPMGIEPVSPYFMQGEGTIRLPDEVYNDVPCEVWDKQDPLSGDEHKVWWAKSDGRPVKMFTSGGPSDISQKDYVSYIPDYPIDPSMFEVPEYCTFPGTETIPPEEVEEIMRTRMAF